MPTVELLFKDTPPQRRRRSPRSYESGWTVITSLEQPRSSVFSGDLAGPQSGSSAGDAVLFTMLTTLPDRSIRVVRSLPAVVRPTSGVYMASLVDTTISASGETMMDAVESLKDIVAAKFRLFSRNESILGTELRCQLRVLQQSLRAT